MKPHKAHRYRIATRCPACRTPLLRVCGYRTCSATQTPSRAALRAHATLCGVLSPRQVRTATGIDLVAEARRIFRDVMKEPSDDLPL